LQERPAIRLPARPANFHFRGDEFNHGKEISMDKFQELSDSEQQSVEGGGVGAFLARVCADIEEMLSTGANRKSQGGIIIDKYNRGCAGSTA
jgi:hypothetical protein